MPDSETVSSAPTSSEERACRASGSTSTTPTSPMCQLEFPTPLPMAKPLQHLQSVTSPPSAPSRLSTSRPSSASRSPPASPNVTSPTTAPPSPNPQSRVDFLRTPASTRPPTPAQVRPPPVLLNVLGASDGESILVIVVEEPPEPREHGAAGIEGGKIQGARVYGGSQGGDIHVWDLHTLALRARLTGHDSAVLALQLVPERNWLISSSGDGTVRVWHTPTLSGLYVIHPPHDNIGDILSLAWVSTSVLEGNTKSSSENTRARATGRLFAGTQDTCIQWIDLPPAFHLEAHSHPYGSIPAHLSYSQPAASSPPIHRAPNKFFDSLSLADRPKSRSGLHQNRNSASATSLVSLTTEFEPSSGEHVIELQFEDTHMALYAHFGYVYCLAVGKSNERDVLISGSGDEEIKLWTMSHHELSPLATLASSADAVLTLAVRDNTVFAGHQGGVIRVWDLDTFTCVRDLHPHCFDILTISVLGDDFYSGAADGSLQRWDKGFNIVSTWPGHTETVLASTTTSQNGRFLITGGNDAVIKIWDIQDDKPAPHIATGFQGPMFHALSKLVSYRTIADDANREECRQGAFYLKRLLRDLGAESCVLPGAPGRNPIVLATFKANSGTPRKRVLCYGHYDVVAADDADKWTHDPFVMSGKNGWLYGRGVSDNKGPMLAIAAAASDLRAKQALDVDMVMVIEGEEETGSAGFQDAIRRNRKLIGDIDVILVSNSYWIGEDIPCLTFGLRGVIHATIGIKSNQPDLHSGMQGGIVSEPLVDMVRVLASLTDADGRVRIPNFLNDVRKLTQEETELYDTVIARCKGDSAEKLYQNSHIADPRRSLITRWRQPALSIHKIEVSGPAQKTLIPSYATSSVSIRIVPDQSLLEMVEQLKAHLHKAFASLRTSNTLSVDINHVADWWLGDIQGPYFHALADCIEAEWGIKPLLIREGGSIPSLPFLEREFGADALQLPLGLSSDAAHLADERIPMINLDRGRSIVSAWLVAIAKLP